MKILLTTLNSKYIHSNLAIKYLYALCMDMGYTVELREFTINNSDDYIYGELLRGDYDLVCFSSYIWNIEKTLYLVENYKKAKPRSMVLLGGPEVTWRAVEIMKKHRRVDYILAGEGEESFPLFITNLISTGPSGDFKDVKGLFFRKEDKIYANPKADPVDFTKVPFPFNSLVGEMDKIMYYESSRGCPFSCSYCISSIERGVRARPIDRVKEELGYFIYKGVKQVKFVDRTFNYNNLRSIEILRFLMESDRGVTNFHFELCGDIISEDFLDLVSKARPGLFQFEIGVQTTNRYTLTAINRKCDFEKLSNAVKKIIEMGNIHLHLDLIAGLPFESYESFRSSFNNVYSLKPHMLQLGFLKLLPGTPIKNRAEEYEYVCKAKAPYEVISNKFISPLELVKLKMVELVLDLYYNRGGFTKTLDYLTCKEGSGPFGFYEDFGEFYHIKGFQHKSQNKEDLYRILYFYGSSKYGFNEVVFNHIKSIIKEDMDISLNTEAVRKFMKTGWELAK